LLTAQELKHTKVFVDIEADIIMAVVTDVVGWHQL
jgi:hypothetical protein